MVVALAIVAAIGDVGRFEQSQKLRVSYLGLNPGVQPIGSSGPRITAGSQKQGRGHAAACSSRRLGRQRRAPFFLRRSAPAAISMSPGTCVLSVAGASSFLAFAEQRRKLRVGPAGVARGKLRDLELAGYKACVAKRRGPRVQYQVPSGECRTRRTGSPRSLRDRRR